MAIRPAMKIIKRIKGCQIKSLTKNVVFIKSIKLMKMAPKKDTKFGFLLPKLDGFKEAKMK